MSDNPLAALAMRERAAKACDGFCNECARSIRALPTTFTNAELLDAMMMRPEVRALVEAAKYIMDGYGLNYPDYKQTEYESDGERVQDDWIVSCLRAALTPFTKGGE